MSGWAAAAGGIIGAAGKAVDSYLSYRQFKKSLKWEKEKMNNQLQWRKRDAEKAGIAPWAAIGSNTQLGNAMPTFRTDFSGMGQDIGEMISKFADPEQKKLRELQIKQEEAKLKNANLQNVRLSKELTEMDKGTSMGGDYNSDGVRIPGSNVRLGQNLYQPPVLSTKHSRGVSEGRPALWTWAEGLHGRHYLTINKDIADSVNEDAMAKSKIYFNRIKDYITGKKPKPQDLPDIPKNMHLIWDRISNQPVLLDRKEYYKYVKKKDAKIMRRKPSKKKPRWQRFTQADRRSNASKRLHQIPIRNYRIKRQRNRGNDENDG